jgi:hypothetical protein
MLLFIAQTDASVVQAGYNHSAAAPSHRYQSPLLETPSRLDNQTNPISLVHQISGFQKYLVLKIVCCSFAPLKM